MVAHTVSLTPHSEMDASRLAAFHAGDDRSLSACYAETFEHVSRVVARVLVGADAETVVHEVFFQLVASETFRRSFTGGSLLHWLGTVARNRALDYARKYRREREVFAAQAAEVAPARSLERQLEAQDLIRRFVRERLPPAWLGVFEERFLHQRSQRDAAVALGIRRTTLAYQELRIRRMLQRYLLSTDLA